MVSLSSAVTQTSENDKRRKQTLDKLDKVKANHLSRQLQMRLQYARLKVEYGWQKQNLNEVENLYFHNSHLRGTKSFSSSTITTTQLQSPLLSLHQVVPSQSSLSFKLGPSSLGRNSMNSGSNVVQESEISQPHQGNIGQKETTQITSPQNQLSHVPMMDSPLQSHSPSETSPIDVDVQERPLISATNQNGLASNENVIIEEGNTSQSQPIPPVVSVTPPENQSPIDPAAASSHYPAAKSSRSRQQKATSTVKGLSSLTVTDMHNFGSTSSLTYDSFWSSHSGSVTPRPAKSNPLGPTDSVGPFSATLAFPGSGADFGRSSTISNMTATSTLRQQ